MESPRYVFGGELLERSEKPVREFGDFFLSWCTTNGGKAILSKDIFYNNRIFKCEISSNLKDLKGLAELLKKSADTWLALSEWRCWEFAKRNMPMPWSRGAIMIKVYGKDGSLEIGVDRWPPSSIPTYGRATLKELSERPLKGGPLKMEVKFRMSERRMDYSLAEEIENSIGKNLKALKIHCSPAFSSCELRLKKGIEGDERAIAEMAVEEAGTAINTLIGMLSR